MISLLILFSVTNVLDLYNWVTERSQLCIHLNPDILEMCFIIEFTIAIIRKLLMDPMWALSEVIIAAVPVLSQQTWEPPAMGSGPLSRLVWDHSWITAGADRASLGECSLREGQTPAIHSADDLQQKGGSSNWHLLCQHSCSWPPVELQPYTRLWISHSGD